MLVWEWRCDQRHSGAAAVWASCSRTARHLSVQAVAKDVREKCSRKYVFGVAGDWWRFATYERIS